jgi:hypothetical protein
VAASYRVTVRWSPSLDFGYLAVPGVKIVFAKIFGSVANRIYTAKKAIGSGLNCMPWFNLDIYFAKLF